MPHDMVLAAGGISVFGSFGGLILAVLIAYACSKIAEIKGRGRTLWAILGFFFTIVALIVIALLPSKR